MNKNKYLQYYENTVRVLIYFDSTFYCRTLMPTFYKLLYFCYFLSSSLAFYFWGQKSLLMLIIMTILQLSLLMSHINLRRISKVDYNIILSFLFIIGWSFLSRGLTQGVLDFLRFTPLMLFCLLPYSISRDVYIFINKLFPLLLLGSFIIYLLVSVFHVEIPNLGILDSGTDRHSLFTNYILYIEPQYDYIQIIPRFNAFFLEPGHLGMICAFMLISNRFNLKHNGNIIYLLSLIFSLSLAGYLLCILGFVLFNMNNIKQLMFPLIVAVFLVLIFTNYNEGDNIFNDLIIERLKFDNEAIERNSRTSAEFDAYFTNHMHASDYLFGIDNSTFRQLQEFNVNGAGYKIYIMNYGIVGIVLIVFFYYSIAFKFPDRRFSIIFLIVLACAFIQRAYPWWFSWILPLYGESIIIESNKQYSKI